MGIYDFNILSGHDRYDTVFTEGKFVASVTEGETRYALHSLSYFWVGVVFNATDNKLTGICGFVEGDKLNRYSTLLENL